MAEQPRDFDAVLGKGVVPPEGGVVLGGLEGVKNRLKSSNIEVQTAALTDALNYGDTGFDLLIEALQDSSEQVRHFAAKLLKRDEIKEKQALLKHDPWLFFTKLEDWKIENFNPCIGITDTKNTAYLVHENQLWKLD